MSSNRILWASGSLGVALSILENAYTAHTQTKYTEKDKVALNNAVHIQMLNGLGVCMLSMRQSRFRMLPGSLLITGSILFPGMIFYSRIYEDKSYMKLVMVGGTCSIAGW
eukprot:CAMPEP_0168611048 /NCGR_PEP_ID=MMETSP0449_2-20121227/2133_1 /TAXON_ID=1082188 /ORGANISM="Strombidium rassoulzadegani, Strain ras09" /LENGTH=109 /DNA_ID=CAMNT_0008651435 /DNA_START=1 /DNA_END=327 /DNA_ORIENTATION=-